MNTKREVVFVTGATGKIGTALVHLLASDASQPLVRAGTRNILSDKAALLRAFNPDTVLPVHFDIDDPVALAQAFEGITRLCIISPFVDDVGGWHKRVMDAATTSGRCEYVVKVSVSDARAPDTDPPPGPIPTAHWQGEEAVRGSGVPPTMIRPTIFAQHFLAGTGLYTRGDDRFYLPSGEGRIAFVDCRDIATMAAVLLLADPETRRPYERQAYELTGPTAVSAADIAVILSLVAGRAVRHVDGVAAFAARCAELGISDGIKFVYKEAAAGWFAGIEHEAFTQVTGKLPTSFARFAFDHAGYFLPA